MTPNLWTVYALIAGLCLGGALVRVIEAERFETIRLSEPTDGVRHYPLAVTNRFTGAVTFCHVTEKLTYACR